MAQLTAGNQNSVLKIREFLGLNENPDGDTHLKPGEFSRLVNFRITRDRHLQLRPGQKTLLNLYEAWSALDDRPAAYPVVTGVMTKASLNGVPMALIAYGGVIWSLNICVSVEQWKDPVFEGFEPHAVGRCQQGTVSSPAMGSFFEFGDKVYFLNGKEFLGWDGGFDSSFQAVEGYVPTIYTACTPAGKGTLLERVNRLTGKRRVKFSPDGTAKVFQLPETEVDEVVGVEGTALTYTLDKAKGTVTFPEAPPAGVNTVSVVYRKGNGAREEVTGMRFAELYNGASDTRVFLYGDGTNKTVYSGVELDSGAPSAEYFPDLNEARVGEANAPITAMIRHYARLLVFKRDSTWLIDYNTTYQTSGSVTAAFTVLPVNRSIGNDAMGQVKLIENNPVSLSSGIAYKWNVASVGIQAGGDVRNAGRISDRAGMTLADFDMEKVVTYNSVRDSELWFLYKGKALILNYAADAWYLYDNMPFAGMFQMEFGLFGVTGEGEVREISRKHRNDDGAEIQALAETGSMDFDRDWLLKYSPQIFVAIQPESGARVTVSVETNRRSNYPEKIVSAGLAGFDHVDFGHFSFGTNRKPQVRRVKMKVKKATFYKLVYRSQSASATVTLLGTDVQLRYAGNVK